MVLWEITLATVYFLGLRRTYRLALRIQRQVLSPRHPDLRRFVHRWIRLRRRLLTRDRLALWGVTTDLSCLLCDDGSESHEHIFNSCPSSCAGWRVFLSLGSFPFFSLADAPWTSLSGCSFTVATVRLHLILIWNWFIWLERNSRMFGNEESTSQIRIRSVFDVVVKVQQSIKKRNIEAGKNVGNSSLWRLNNVKPSTQVVVNAVKPPTSSINIPRYAATRSRLLATRRSIVRITDHVKRGRSFFTPWTISMRSFPTIAMMMRPLKPAGLNGQYRHVSQYMPNSPAFQHRILGSSEGVFRKDIAQWMLHSS